jgi:hypothetical protein
MTGKYVEVVLDHRDNVPILVPVEALPNFLRHNDLPLFKNVIDFGEDAKKKAVSITEVRNTESCLSTMSPESLEVLKVRRLTGKHDPYSRPALPSNISSAADMERGFSAFLRTDFSSTSFDLNEIYATTSYRFYPGEFVVIIGDTKLGKTAFVQNVCVRLPRFKVLYFSLEVNERLMFRRFIQDAHGMSKQDVFKHYQSGKQGLGDAISHIAVVEKPPTFMEMKQAILAHKPQLVVVDTIDGIAITGVSDANSKSDMIGRTLKELATELDVILVGIHHISKAASRDQDGNAKKLNVHSGKGSSSIEQKADKIIGIEGNEGSQYRRIFSLASRDETHFNLTMTFNWETFTFNQLPTEIKACPTASHK